MEVAVNVDEMQAGPEMDALVAVWVMEWESVCDEWYDKDGVWQGYTDSFEATADFQESDIWNPSRRIQHTWQAVEQMMTQGAAVNINHWDGNSCEDTIWNVIFAAPHYRGEASCHTVELAICRAALRAIEDLNKNEKCHQKEVRP